MVQSFFMIIAVSLHLPCLQLKASIHTFPYKNSLFHIFSDVFVDLNKSKEHKPFNSLNAILFRDSLCQTNPSVISNAAHLSFPAMGRGHVNSLPECNINDIQSGSL